MASVTAEWVPFRTALLLSWLALSVCAGAFTVIFFPIGVAVAVAGALASPALLALLLQAWSYERLLLVTVVAMSNLFLLHKVIALHLPNGDNLFGIRDVLLIAVLVVGLYTGRDRLFLVARHPLVWPGIVIFVLLPSAALLGLINGASVVNVGRETITFTMWLLPLVVAANVRSVRQFRLLFKTFVVLGVLIAIGVILEVVSFGALQLVSTIRTPVFGSLLVRVFPDAWVFILVAFFSAIVSILSKKNTLRECGVFGLTITAVVLTLQRGMLFATLGGTCILVALVAMSRHRDLLARRAVAPATVFFLILAAVAYSAGQISPILNDWLATRYKDAGNDLGGRFYELTKVGEVFRTDPLAGLGLGARYRDALPETFGIANTGGMAVNNAGDDGTFCHNFVGFCLVKLGLPGALAFFAFGIAVLIRFFRYSFCQCDPEVRRYGLTLFTALFVCLILAQTDNVFGDLRTLPICMTAAGMMVALELIQHPECVCSPSETTTISERAAANATRSGCGKSPV